jgi:hypothetical protein
MELRHLRYFVAVVKGKGFREVSRRFVCCAARDQPEFAIGALPIPLGAELKRVTLPCSPMGNVLRRGISWAR